MKVLSSMLLALVLTVGLSEVEAKGSDYEGEVSSVQHCFDQWNENMRACGWEPGQPIPSTPEFQQCEACAYVASQICIFLATGDDYLLDGLLTYMARCVGVGSQQ